MLLGGSRLCLHAGRLALTRGTELRNTMEHVVWCVLYSSKEPNLTHPILKRVALGSLSHLSSPSFVGGNVLTTLGVCDHRRPQPYYTILADYRVDFLYTRRIGLAVLQQLGHLFRVLRRLY